jgi:hypothetical protein
MGIGPDNTVQHFSKVSQISGKNTNTPLVFSRFSGIVSNRAMDDEEWGMDNGPWIMDDGQWRIDHGRWIMDHGTWTIDHRPWIIDFGQ